MEMKTCSRCRKSYPANLNYFHGNKNTKDGLVSSCKECKNEYQRSYKKMREKHGTMYSLRGTSGWDPTFDGIKTKASNLKFKKSKYYTVEYMGNERSRATFTGKPIFEKDEYVVLRSKTGRCESFLKVNFFIKEARLI